MDPQLFLEDPYDAFAYDLFEGEDDPFEDDGFEDDLFADGYEDDGYEDDGFEADGFEDGGFEDDGFEDDAFEDDGFEDDGFEDDGFEYDSFEDDAFEDELFDGFDGFQATPGGLLMPKRGSLVVGPAATAAFRAIEAASLDALDADEVDEFFKKLGRGLKSFGKKALGGLKKVGRAVAPMLKKALPMIQKVAGLAGPWGRVISGGIGAVRGLASGKGLKGALAGAASGLLPGIGGKLAGAFLRFDGAGDDAALDALADLTQQHRLPGRIVLPLASALATRSAVKGGLVRGRPLSAITRVKLWRRARPLPSMFRKAAKKAGGPVERQVRTMRSAARVAASQLAKATRQAPTPAVVRATPKVAAKAANTVARRAAANPSSARSTPKAAAVRNARRRNVILRTPVAVIVSR